VHGTFDSVAHFSWRLLACLGALLAVLAILAVLSTVTVPIAVALLLSAASTPLVDRLRARGMKPTLAAIVATLAVLLLCATLVFIVVVTVGRQWDEIAAGLNQGLNRLASWLQSSVGLPASVVQQSGQAANAATQTLAPVLLGGVVRFVSGGVALIGETLLAFLLMFYFLLGGSGMWEWMLRQMGRPDGGRTDRTARRCWKSVEGYMFGAFVVGLCDGAAIGIGLWLLGVPSALAVGVLTVFAEFIPIVGATVMGVVAVLLAFGHGGLSSALWALVIIFPVQQINGHITAPIVYGHAVELSPVVVLLAILTGGTIAGMLGMLIAIPVAGVLGVILAELRLAPPLAQPAEPRAASNQPWDSM
jgi:predicted PurR-regulated permease PerM